MKSFHRPTSYEALGRLGAQKGHFFSESELITERHDTVVNT